MNFRLLSALLTALVFMSACNSGINTKPAGDKKSGGKTEIVVRRYEKALFNLNPDDLRTGLDRIYPDFRFFLGNDWKDTMNLLRIYNYITDPDIRQLYALDTVRFPDTEFLKTGLLPVFNQLQKYYPDRRLPVVYTYVSGLDVELPVIYADSALAISLDLFLAAGDPVYSKAGIPEYMSKRFSREYILPACVKAISDSIVKVDENRQALLDYMIAAGKRLYLMDVLLPDVKDTYKIGYTTEKLEWCNQNEGRVWAFLAGNQLLFSSDPKVVGKMMVDAPFTSGLVSESPGRIGEWVGWKIVRAYVKANPSVTLQELMRNVDSQAILQASKYKPRK